MKVKVDGLGDVGMITDLDATELPPNGWTNLLNIRCVHGRIEPVDGYSDITAWTNVGTKDVYAHALETIETGINYYLIYPYDDDGDGQCEKIYAYLSGTGLGTDISRAAGYAGGVNDLWNTCTYNGNVILNNGEDCPQYWDGNITNLAVDLPWDTAGVDTWDNTDGGVVDGSDEYHAKIIRSFKNFLFAMDITETIAGNTKTYPYMVHWSGVADPGDLPTWKYGDTDNLSGRTSLTETGGSVVDAVPLNEQLVIYKEDAIYMCAYVGGQFVFQFRTQATSHGLWATNCAVDIGGRHVCLGDGVVYLFDGHTPRNILEGKDADNFFNQIDPVEYKKAFLTHNKSEEEVWICFPEIGETWATKALIWNYKNDTWYYRTIPATSEIKTAIITDTELDAWDDGTETSKTWEDETTDPWEERTYSPVGDTFVAASDQLIQFGQGYTSDSVEATRTNIIIEDPTSWYRTKKMFPVGTGESFNIAVGGQIFVDGPVYWETAQSFDPGTTRKLDWRNNYPIKTIKVTGTADSYWTFNSYVLEHERSSQR